MSQLPPASRYRDRRGRRSAGGNGTRLLLGVTAGVVMGAFVLDRFHAPLAELTPLPSAPLAWQVYFSPEGGCTEAIVGELNRAKTSVRVQAYSFTSKPIAKALVDAARRGVDVRVILDKSQRGERYSSADFLAHAGVPVLIDEQHAIAHDKVMVIDKAAVITGSFNFTNAAEARNSENLLIIRDPKLAARYGANWDHHRQHAEAYAGK